MHVLVTGASSGIGEGLARTFGRHGAKLTIVARREDKLRSLASELSGGVNVVPADLGNLSAVDSVIERATAELGPIDVLVNNAGVQLVGPFRDVSVEDAESLYRIDLLAPMRLIQRALPSMLERRSGTIVNVASLAGIVHTPGMCFYNSAKAGLGAASESLRVELADTGVHVLTVYPGPVATPMEAAARASLPDTRAVRNLPTGTVDELARRVVRAIERRSARVIYPSLYGPSWFIRPVAQAITDRFTPKV